MLSIHVDRHAVLSTFYWRTYARTELLWQQHCGTAYVHFFLVTCVYCVVLIVVDLLAGRDNMDSTTAGNTHTQFTLPDEPTVAGMKIGVPRVRLQKTDKLHPSTSKLFNVY